MGVGCLKKIDPKKNESKVSQKNKINKMKVNSHKKIIKYHKNIEKL